ncbi:MAG TPA: SPOR domain-containing protein [Stellaceae bacterium]|nr:SPOR domain-containing protein [Stellaceae bacterium]
MPRPPRLVFLALAALLPAGCALPPAVTLASLAADGVSYATTGKSVSDHGISAATGNDCALMRPVFTGKAMCQIDSTRGKDVPVETGHAAVARPIAPALATAPAKDRYVQVGSFRDAQNAARAATRYADLKPDVRPVDAGGVRYYRVRVGPLSAPEERALKARLVQGNAKAGAG